MKFCNKHPELLCCAILECERHEQIIGHASHTGSFSIEKTKTNQSGEADEGEQCLVSPGFINKIVSCATVNKHRSQTKGGEGERVVWRRKDWEDQEVREVVWVSGVGANALSCVTRAEKMSMSIPQLSSSL